MDVSLSFDDFYISYMFQVDIAGKNNSMTEKLVRLAFGSNRDKNWNGLHCQCGEWYQPEDQTQPS